MNPAIFQVKPDELRTEQPFSTLFPRSEELVKKMSKQMAKDGFDPAFPLTAWNGVVVDGNTRLAAARHAKLSRIPVVYREFKDETAALAYAIHCQRDRRNLTDAEILRCVQELDKRQPHGGDRKSDQSATLRNEAGETAAKTAAAVGISQRKVEQVRTVLDKATPEVKAAVEAGDMSINAAYRETVKPQLAQETATDATPEPREWRVSLTVSVTAATEGEARAKAAVILGGHTESTCLGLLECKTQ